MKKLYPIYFAAIIGLFPLFAFAQTIRTNYFDELISKTSSVLNALLPLLVGIAVLGIFYGLSIFIFQASNEEKRREARSIMIWGVIAITVMISIYAIVLLLQTVFGVGGNQSPRLPQIPSYGGGQIGPSGPIPPPQDLGEDPPFVPTDGFTDPVDGLGWE